MAFPGPEAFQAILDSLADGVFTVDLDWNVTFFNKAASRITGIAEDEALGRKCWEVLHSSLCDGACPLRSSMGTGLRVSSQSIFIVNAEGEKVPISISAAPLLDSAGECVGGVETFRDLTELHMMRKEMEGSYTFEDIVSKSPALTKIFSIIPQIAKSDAPVLLLGESGTGKELFAKALHTQSNRAKGPFVAVNCGALPENLLESELFGYKAGAFTDARADKPGRFELAAGGTIFLDEIGEMPQHLQVKLLRVLQEKCIEPLGAVKPVNTDVRVIAATNRDLEKDVAEGIFRRDLYYRLNVVTLRLPPLSERPEDIPLLVSHFRKKLNATTGKDIQGVGENVMHVLMHHDFPGNVRELENILEFAFILCPGGFIQLEHLPEHLRPAETSGPPTNDSPSRDHPLTMDEIKCLAVREALARNQGKRMKTCRELNITKDTLRRLLSRCGE